MDVEGVDGIWQLSESYLFEIVIHNKVVVIIYSSEQSVSESEVLVPWTWNYS